MDTHPRTVRMPVLRALAPLVLLAACAAGGEAADGADTGADGAPADASDAGTDVAADATGGDGGVGATGNRPPVLAAIGARDFAAGRVGRITLAAEDADGDELSYFARGVPAGGRFDKPAGIFEWTPADDDVGREIVLSLGVTDTHGAEDRELVTVTVVADVAAGPPELLDEGVVRWPAGREHAWAVPVVDPDGDALSYLVVGTAPAGLVVGATTGIVRWTAPAELAGSTVALTLRASDDDGSDEATYTLQIEAAGVERLDPIVLFAGETLDVDVAIGTPGLSCALAVDSDPLPGGARLDGCRLQWAIPGSATDDWYVFRVEVDDPATAAAPDIVREVELLVLEAIDDGCEALPTETIVADAATGSAEVGGLWCDPAGDGVVRVEISLPPGARTLRVGLTHDEPETVDLDLYVTCGSESAESTGVVGDEQVSLSAALLDWCVAEVVGIGVVSSPVAWTLVAEVTGDDDPVCPPPPAIDVLVVDDLIEVTACPDRIDRFAVDFDVVAVEVLAEDGDLDLRVVAVGDAGERTVAETWSDGPSERIVVDWAEAALDELLYVDVLPWRVDVGGTPYLLSVEGP
jgi:hypothetical protein